MADPRAKYLCNPKLEEYIELANIVPTEFDFEWSPVDDRVGNNPKFKKWIAKLVKLSNKQVAELLTAKIDNIAFPLYENFSGEQTEEEVRKFGGIALIQFLRVKSIRGFLRSLIKLNELSQEKNIQTLTPDNNVFESLSHLHSNVEELFRLPAAQKVYKALMNDLISIEDKKMMGIVVQYTSNCIGADEPQKFNITENEKTEFLAKWAESFADTFPSLDDPTQTLKSFDLLAQTLFEIESRISTVNVSVDTNGNVHFELNKFAESLQGVNISRLRLCEYCNSIFWANRKDSYTCSPKHARNRRMRLLRQRWKESGDLYLEARKKKAKKEKGE